MGKVKVSLRKVGRGFVVMMGRIPIETSTTKAGARMIAKRLRRKRR